MSITARADLRRRGETGASIINSSPKAIAGISSAARNASPVTGNHPGLAPEAVKYRRSPLGTSAECTAPDNRQLSGLCSPLMSSTSTKAAVLHTCNRLCAPVRGRVAGAVVGISDDEHRVPELVKAVTAGDDLLPVGLQQESPPGEGRREHELGTHRAVQVR